ncbi:hypothetical protein J132_11042 [Termitomyces sp. J132]|nr:hypothetical protein H2248_006802 [Termitomyces sp. 'cryptogamus']KNZ78602.1 hypothetical protein J132_11042 [Termitomyces sp. J132]
MPLFVHLLRVLMLFLNVYDSYKTLRLPPPSLRNQGRPSQRALVQRKRDMKGCLAVWIVWVCVTMYEGHIEGLVSLFVPFYDEIKCLGLLFLIMTRARGAEPIYLNFIRPLIKPYGPTIDLALDLVRMFGDILFVILAIPTEYVHTWYKKFIPRSDTSLDSETETSPVTSTPPRLVSSLKRSADNGKRDQQPLCVPKKTNSDRRPSANSDHQPPQPRTRVDQVGQRTQTKAHPDPHQIWYPPPSYSDEEDTSNTLGPDSLDSQPPRSTGETDGLSTQGLQEKKAIDEWRQYPAFPSAYPATPMVAPTTAFSGTSTTATRVQHIANSLMLTEISEDLSRQDFSRSLLPPRKPLNPGFVGGSSDEIQTPGVQLDRLESMSVDSDSEDEDSFNTTLQTPMASLRATRCGITSALINREISVASSVATESTVLSSNTRNSSQTQSSESLSSGDISMSDLSPVSGKKRPLPLDALDVNTASQISSGRNGMREALGNVARSQRFSINRRSRTQIDIVDGDTKSTFSTTDSIDDRKPKLPKRRKVIQTPKRPTLVTRPIRARHRIARIAISPAKSTISRPLKVPSSSRDAPSHLRTHRTNDSVASDASRTKSPSSIDEAAKKTTQTSLKSIAKGKSRQFGSHPPSKAT